MARPKKEETSKNEKRITIRLSQSDYDILCTYADLAKLPPSVYARKQILNGSVPITCRIVIDLEQIKELTHQFLAISNHLNQIAKYFHMGGVRSKAMQDEIHECIQTIFEMREKVLSLSENYMDYPLLHKR